LANNVNKKLSGFTLIEVMLVIVILTIITLGGFNILSQKVTTVKINKAVSQIQQIFNASYVFYNQYAGWPCSVDRNSKENIIKTRLIEFNHYLPKDSEINPWGGEYRAKPVGTVAQNNNPNDWGCSWTVGPANYIMPRLQVSVHFPASFPKDKADAIAERLQAILPNASINRNGSLPVVEVSVPVSVFQSSQPKIKIASIQDEVYIRHGKKISIPKPKCELGQTPNIIASIQNINTIGGLILYGFQVIVEPETTNWLISISAPRGGIYDNGGEVSIITYCAR